MKKHTDSFIYRDSCPDVPIVNKSHESEQEEWLFLFVPTGLNPETGKKPS